MYRSQWFVCVMYLESCPVYFTLFYQYGIADLTSIYLPEDLLLLWPQTYSRFCRVAALIVAGLKPRMHSRRIELPVKLNWDVLKQKPQNWVPRTEGESRCFILSKQNLLLRCCGSVLRRYLKVMKMVLQKCSKRNWLWCCWAFSTASSARCIFRKRLSSLLWLWFA